MTWLRASVYANQEGVLDVRSLGVAESSPFDSDPGIALSRLFANFRADMLPFSVTISPNEQYLRIPRLLLNVVGNWLAFLPSSAQAGDVVIAARLTGSILMIVSASKS